MFDYELDIRLTELLFILLVVIILFELCIKYPFLKDLCWNI